MVTRQCSNLEWVFRFEANLGRSAKKCSDWGFIPILHSYVAVFILDCMRARGYIHACGVKLGLYEANGLRWLEAGRGTGGGDHGQHACWWHAGSTAAGGFFCPR